MLVTVQSGHLAQYFSNVGHLLSHLLMLLYPTVVLTLERQFSLSYGELLSLAVPGAVLYGICALPAGWLGDRWSAEYMMVIFYVGSGLAAILTGLTTGPLGIAVGLTLVGLFGAVYHPVGLAWLVRNAENRGQALGLNGLFGSIGIGTASLVAASLTALAGWRAAFVVPGALCIAIGVALWFSVRRGLVVAATTSPLRTDNQSATPIAMQRAPGTRKAARHPASAVNDAATNEALPMPMLPNSPLRPRAWPRFSAFRTSQASPTGW